MIASGSQADRRSDGQAANRRPERLGGDAVRVDGGYDGLDRALGAVRDACPCRLDVGDVGRGSRLPDLGTDGARGAQETPGAAAVQLHDEAGDTLERFDQHPAIGSGIHAGECGLQVPAGCGERSLVNVEARKVKVSECDSRPRAGIGAGVDGSLGVSPRSTEPPHPAGDRRKPVGDGSLHGPMGELFEHLERGLARPQRGLQIAPLPLREEDRGERQPAGEWVASGVGNAERPLECRQCGRNIALVGEQRPKMQQRDPRLSLDAGIVEANEGFLEQLPSER